MADYLGDIKLSFEKDEEAPKGDYLGDTVLSFEKEDEAPSLLKETGKAVVRGVGGVGQMAGHLLKFAGAEETGTALDTASDKLTEDYAMHPEVAKSFVKRGILGGIESMLPSVSAGIPGAIIGSKIGSVLGPKGALVGGLGGGIIGYALGGGTLMGVAEYQNYLDEHKKEFGTAPDSEVKANAALSGLAEGGFEALSDFIGGKLVFKNTLRSGATAIRDILRRPLKEALTDYAKIVGTETTTEALTGATQAYARQLGGIPTQGIGEAAAESVIPAAVMSTLFMGGGVGLKKLRTERIERAMGDPTIDPESRLRAAADIQEIIEGSYIDPKTKEITPLGQETAVAWQEYALAKIREQQPINLDLMLDPLSLKIEVAMDEDPAGKAAVQPPVLDMTGVGAGVEGAGTGTGTFGEFGEWGIGGQQPVTPPATPPVEEAAPVKPSVTARDYAKEAADAGVRFVGIQKGTEGVPDYPLFEDPQTGSSFGLEGDEPVASALQRVRDQFKKPVVPEQPPEAPPAAKTPPPPVPPPVNGKRNWYELKDLPYDQLTDEEMDRLSGRPTPEETAVYDQWRKDKEAAATAADVGKRTEAEEGRAVAADIVQRVQRKWSENNPHISIPDVAAHIGGIRQTVGETLKASDYLREVSGRLGIENRHEFLGRILDKLGVPIILTDSTTADPNGAVKTDGVFIHPSDKSSPGRIIISHKAMAASMDYGPGYGVAHASETFVHEALHAIVRNAPNWRQSEKRLKAFRDTLLKHQNTAPEKVLKYLQHSDRYDIDELISEALSDSVTAQWLDSIPAEGVRNPSKTLWGQLKDIIFRALETFGLPKSKLDELNEILDEALAIPAEGAGLGQTAPPPKGDVRGPIHGTFGPISEMNTVALSDFFYGKLRTYDGKIDKNLVKVWVSDEYGITARQLTELEQKGKYDHKTVEEAFEYAIVKKARELIDYLTPDSVLPEVIKLYDNQPNLASRTSESTIMQQYSTPAPIAWLMNKFLGMTGRGSGVSVYEPTAGNGMLLMGADDRSSQIFANELDKGARITNLRDFLPQGKVTNADALSLAGNPGAKTVDRVIMNPPFGTASHSRSYNGYTLSKLEHQIVASALSSMKDNGKAAFIIGGHNIKSSGQMTMPDRIFMNWLYNNYNVTHNIDVNGDLYARQGTKFPIRLITIEGRNTTPATGIPTYANIEPANTFRDIASILERTVPNANIQGQGATPTGQTPVQEGGGRGEGAGGIPPQEGQTGPGVRNPPVSGESGGGLQPGGRGGEGRPGEPAPGERQSAGEGGRPAGAVEPGVIPEQPRGSGESVVRAGEEGGTPREPRVEGPKSDVDAAIDELGSIEVPQFMPYEKAEEETFYQEKMKPVAEKIATAIVNEEGLDVQPPTFFSKLKDRLAERYDTYKKYMFRWVKEEFGNLIQMIRDASLFQVPYKPLSKGIPGNTLVPRNQEQSFQKALKAIEAEHGDIDDWVMSELGYKDRSALHKAFASEQVDALALAIQNIRDNAGMIIGDQTGVGKGRVVAGIIRWANMRGLTPIFVTEKGNLFSDMYRDLTAIDHKIRPFIMNDKQANIVNQETGELIMNSFADGKGKEAIAEGRDSKGNKTWKVDWEKINENPRAYLERNGMKAVFTTYSQHNSSETKQQDAMLGAMAGNNIFILDESHNAAGPASGDDSNTKVKFTNFLDRADAVLYSSATFAKTPYNMAIYFRTALGDTGMRMFELIDAIVRGGNPLQEYISNALANKGQYLRRELDFSGIDFLSNPTMENTPDSDPRQPELKAQYERDKRVADKSNDVVRKIIAFSDDLHAKHNKTRLTALLADKGVMLGGTGNQRMSLSSTTFASVVHNFSAQLLTAIKVDRTINEAEQALKEGRKVVINLMNTMGSFVEDMVKKGHASVGDPIDFTYKGVLNRAIENTLRLSVSMPGGEKVYITITPEELEDYLPSTYAEYRRAKAALDSYDISDIHSSPIDYMTSRLKALSNKPVMEITGRKYKIDYDAKGGKPVLQNRASQEQDRQRSIRMFNSGESNVIIINRAGSVGISLHASETFKDQSPRRMLLLQPDLDINVFMQALGRIFRKGQVTNPDYRYITSDLPAEIRPSVILRRKMSSLKANTTSKQEGTETRKEIPDMMNKYGDQIARDYLDRNRSIAVQAKLINSFRQNIPSDLTYAKISGKMTVLPVELQKDFYSEVESDYNSYIDELTAKGENDLISKNFDYKARTITKNVIYGGVDPTDPFSGSTYVEQMLVRQLKQPHNTAKIQSLAKEALNGKTAAEFSQGLLVQTKDAATTYWNTWKATLEEKYPGEPDRQQRAAGERQRQLANEYEHYKTLLSMLRIGDTYSVPLGQNSQENLTGVLTNIIWKPGPGNPVQPSKLKLVFSVSDPIQTMVFNGSQGWFRDEVNLEERGIPANWDTVIPSSRTEEKVIVTGNMLRAFNIITTQSPRIGFEMVNFSREDGSKEFGLVIARKDEERVRGLNEGNLGREVGWQEAYDYLSDARVETERLISSKNGEVNIESVVTVRPPEEGGTLREYVVRVIGSKDRGAKYFQDEKLRSFVRNQNFRKHGNKMVANIDGDNLRAFMEELKNKFNMNFVLPQEQAHHMPYEEATIDGLPYKAFMPTLAQVESELRASRYSMNDNYKSAIILMHPRTFLQLAALGGDYLKSRVKEYGKFDEKRMDTNDLPTLYVGDNGKINGHEGRARMTLAMDAGVERMPVILYHNGDKWSPSDPAPRMVSDETLGIIKRDVSPIPLDRNITAEQVLSKLRGIEEEVQMMPYVSAITDRFLKTPQTALDDKAVKTIKDFSASQNDFQFQDKYFGLPWWNAKKYPAWRRAFEIFGIVRPEERGRYMHEFAQIAEPFFTLDKAMRNAGKSRQDIQDAKDRINRVIITGDALLGQQLKDLRRQLRDMRPGPERDRVQARIHQIETENRYSDEQLLAGIKDDQGNPVKLSQEEIEVYKSVRKALDAMFDAYVDHLQTQAFRNYQKQKWYAILLQAAGIDLSKEQAMRIVGGGLNRAALLRAVKIQPDIQKIFARVENKIANTPDAEKVAAGELYGKIADKLTQEISDLKAAIGEVTGIKDEKELMKTTQAVLGAYMFTRPQLKKIKALRNTYKKHVAFFPRVREQGPYKLKLMMQIKDKEGLVIKERQLFMGMYKTDREGLKLYQDMLKRYGKGGVLPENMYVVPEQSTKTPEFAFQGVSDINMQKVFDDAIEGMKIRDSYFDEKGNRVSVLDNLRDMGYQAIAKQFQSRGFGRHMTHRQWNVIKGYEENELQQVLFNYMSGMSGIMTKQAAAADFLEHMKEVKDPKMFEALAKYGRDQLRNETNADKYSNKVRSFMFTWYLGGVLRPAIIQLTQNFVTGIPEHAKYLRENSLGGAGKADKDYIAAMTDVARKNYTEPEKRMQDQLFTHGVTVDQYIREIFGGLGSRFSQERMRVLKWLAIPFSRMEQFNRQSAALTRFRPAYEMALKKVGEDFTEQDAYNEAFESARAFVYDTHYAMGKANLPQVAQGAGVGVAIKTLYTFKSFTHNFVLWNKNNLSDKDWRTFMHSMAYLALFGGLMGLPFLKDIFEWVEKEFGYSFSKSIRQSLRGAGGKTLETFGMNGLPALLGANMSGSLAIGVPFMGDDSLSTIGGVYEGQYKKLKQAGEAALRGDKYRVAANILPEFARTPLTAAVESGAGKEILGTRGYTTTTRGRPVYDEAGKPLSMGPGEAVAKVVGFSPTEFGREKEKNQTLRRQEAWAAEEKADAAERYRIAKVQGDPAALKNLMRDVKEINEGIKSRGIEKLVPRASLSRIIQSSRNVKGAKERRGMAYKAEL